MRNINRRHIKIEGCYESLSYTAHRPKMSVDIELKEQNRVRHGNDIKRQLKDISIELELLKEVELPSNIVRDDVIYVDFSSEWGYELSFKSFDSTVQDTYKLLNIRKEIRSVENTEEYRYHVTVVMSKGGVSKFLSKVETFLRQDKKPNKKGEIYPRNSTLINNIELIKKATLKSFWTDNSKFPFPENLMERRWWEVWFRKNDATNFDKVRSNLELYDVTIGGSELNFVEHTVRLLYGSVEQLSNSLLLLDNLAELRKPQEISDFILGETVGPSDRQEWLDDLVERVNPSIDENSVLVCLLDSGVNNSHPLLQPFLPDENLYTYEPSWGTHDGEGNGGHGTLVAGIALYGDLTLCLGDTEEVNVYHGLESYKIYNSQVAIDPELYGALTEGACDTSVIYRANNPRVFCMTITTTIDTDKGRPSAWSAALDKIAFGSSSDSMATKLFIVSGGNVDIKHSNDYPLSNLEKSVENPGQAYNAITVGTYTEKDRMRNNTANYRPLAELGGMGPTNSTSMDWEKQWPIKPEIVMEGGNIAYNDEGYIDRNDDLRLVSTDKRIRTHLFSTFGDSSAAAPLAAKLAAELMTAYPKFWPETIRGLIIHSAEWTDAMKIGKDISVKRDVTDLLRTVGYGVPNEKRAFECANNSLTLIAERTIQPYTKLRTGDPKTHKYHLFELPWPRDVLSGILFDKDITITVTLSYFIEPNPGSKTYASKYNYQSHELDFMVIKPEETIDVFKRRVSSAGEGERVSRKGEEWVLKSTRSRGSIKKDFYTMTGADMAERNVIAIYPKNGWYRIRKALNKFNEEVRYSLIISLDTPETDVDIYTPVLTQIATPIEL